MRAQIFPISETPVGRLAIMPRPRTGDWLADEIASWQDAGIDMVVSLLEFAEAEELGLCAESDLCEKAGVRFLHFPISDRSIPRLESSVTELVNNLVAELRGGRGVGIHCRMGIGRSSTIAVCVLAALGMPVDIAWQAVEGARGLPVPDTNEQRDWVDYWVAGFGRESEPNAS